ncbi:uncharacterized protein AIMP2 isoform X4 [Maniola hyperantus]|uniref:uncharacterized protein AIMP2 isoform X4 n=1 Tax=Aphantopus hyperantus TaxID=2795564 RepID=UPI003749C292
MYHMKNLVSQEQSLVLPKCMYYIKNPIEGCLKEEMEINVCDQVIKFLKISSEEIVVVLNPNVLPWFLNKFLKEIPLLNVTWHVHSSVPTEKIPIIDAFFGKYQDLYRVKQGCKINLRLIFKCESTTPELKFSSLSFPILGAVNIIRYLCLTYDNIAPYDYCNYEVDAMLDSAYQLETASEKSRALLISKIFPQSKEWIYRDRFSIIDLAVFNVVIQLQNGIKYVPKKWFNNCEKMIL